MTPSAILTFQISCVIADRSPRSGGLSDISAIGISFEAGHKVLDCAYTRSITITCIEVYTATNEKEVEMTSDALLKVHGPEIRYADNKLKQLRYYFVSIKAAPEQLMEQVALFDSQDL